MKIANTYIIGLGALGAIYAASLYDMDPKSVKIIASKKRSAAFQQQGIVINDKHYDFTFIEPGDATQAPADLIIVSVKHHQLPDAINDIAAFIGSGTIIISLLNGVSSEQMIGAAHGMDHLLYAYGVGMDAVRDGKQIVFKNKGKVVFGAHNNKVLSGPVAAVKELFEQAAIPHQIPENMYQSLWGKFMMNVGINQASAVLRAPYGVFQQNAQARQLMLLAMHEVMAISQKMEINLTQTDLDGFMHIIGTLNPAGKTSMLQDVEAGRQTEVDIFARAVIELGAQVGVPTPVNQTLFNIIKVIESQAG
ncbi:ketopantoate reductase family protein [Janthinobacterium agaricidamnosum]|uniref:2-dehydropantoate 2-reductase n=1 Tax=Janthinobacterium agaricidamnosum NBRC 102515 = DSM 9628 TaxID=1349767 RepID=W0UWQ4_9BURK|nr:ketopantoate reductase family protein [Janthinobacterium agaricidamnosum]CDG80859.1 2-dehydropantoate 2-reductase [Janthinobacterium agaricidamnosum NBRC 102515 = DSM 9628]